jgi:mono/diheme cytochrome c family protein
MLPGPSRADTPQWRSGEDLYNKVCGYCHKPAVGVGTVLEGRELPVVYLKAIVRHGLNAMPAFPASYVDDASLAELSTYLATLPTPAPRPAAEQRAQAQAEAQAKAQVEADAAAEAKSRAQPPHKPQPGTDGERP